jgi:predicted permease
MLLSLKNGTFLPYLILFQLVSLVRPHIETKKVTTPNSAARKSVQGEYVDPLTNQRVLGNPVIISAMAGILASIFHLPIPKILQRVLDILSGMALPLALLLIGGSLELDLVKKYLGPSMGAIFIKLMVLPAEGLGLFFIFNVSYLPGLILLASPTATITYVMSREMRGDPEFAAANISAGTLLSAVTFSFWLMIAGG